jgi:hypothetical protein
MVKSKDAGVTVTETISVNSQDDVLVHREDNILLGKLGYKSEFKREFSVSQFLCGLCRPDFVAQLLETISFSMAILAVSCGITTGYSYPLLSGQ